MRDDEPMWCLALHNDTAPQEGRRAAGHDHALSRERIDVREHPPLQGIVLRNVLLDEVSGTQHVSQSTREPQLAFLLSAELRELIEGMIHKRMQPLLGTRARIVGCYVKAMGQKGEQATKIQAV